MIVCVCNALNERVVQEAARKVQEKGKASVLDVYASLGARPQCGKCLCEARNICDRQYQTQDNAC